MTDLSAIRAHIAHVRQQLLNSPVFVAGRPDSSEKAKQEAARLESLAEALRLIVRDLNSTESGIRARESELRKIPKDQRWSTEQSVKQLAENIRVVNQQAQALADLDRELLDRNGLLRRMMPPSPFGSRLNKRNWPVNFGHSERGLTGVPESPPISCRLPHAP